MKYLLKSTLVLLLITTLSCTKTTTTTPSGNNNNNGGNNLPPTYTAGYLEFTSNTTMGYNAYPTQYSYRAQATFYDAVGNKVAEGKAKVYGTYFTQSGAAYLYTTQNVKPNDTINWSVSTYTVHQQGNLVKDSNININQLLPFITEMTFDSIHRGSAYGTVMPMTASVINSLDSVSVTLNGMFGSITQNRDSMIFNYQNTSQAINGCPVGTACPINIQIIGVHFKDTLIGNHKYHFAAKQILNSHAYLKAH